MVLTSQWHCPHKALTTRLYNLGQSHKFANSSVLSQNVIDYLVKCFTIAIHQGNGDPKDIQASLKSIVPHAYGIHDNCTELGCGCKQDPTFLMVGKYMEKVLINFFAQCYCDPVVEKLAPAANSQRNEAFNSIVGPKAPKIRFYGGSESNDFSCSSTNQCWSPICQQDSGSIRYRARGKCTK